jgi:hypothetical protein
MGHQIEQKLSAGACQLTQCSCGRGALKIRNKVIFLSSAEISEMSRLFSGLAQPASIKPDLTEKLNQLTDGQPWVNFTPND